MEITPAALDPVKIVRLSPRGDERGYFMRTYDSLIFESHGMQTNWVQENQSLSTLSGTLRGLHYQGGPSAETKLVRVLRGRILDVAVDIRCGSPTFGRHVAVELSAANQLALYVPRGFAHGFLTLEPDSLVAYKVDSYYSPADEGGLRWNDPGLAIHWPLPEGKPSCISEKDENWPFLSERDDL
jgi:dTDP-4-dehydrorhamnose 3,5-epimerase